MFFKIVGENWTRNFQHPESHPKGWKTKYNLHITSQLESKSSILNSLNSAKLYFFVQKQTNRGSVNIDNSEAVENSNFTS